MNLSEALQSPDTVLFVGSGVSAWSDLPSWGKLLEELADYLDHHGIASELVRAEIRHGDLLQAASYGFDKLTRPQQGEFMRSACRYGRATPSRLHQLLVTLGPRCFVTTNYDNLIEEALRLWKPTEFFRPPVTNRDLIGMPEIVQARSFNFIFKPHGDAADAESIVLTREQYRMLMPGGERHAALESLKLMLVSRPVVYVGFGLRDPDFLYLRDILLNIYKGGTRDHYALMSDVSMEQVDYWRRTYGIHLIPYETSLRSDGSRDHSKLLTVLEAASGSAENMRPLGKAPKSTSPEMLLALARYASSLSQTDKLTGEFTIHVVSKRKEQSDRWRDRSPFEGAKVETLLDGFEKPTILIGLPGAGKSYALRKSAARQAEKLHAACLQVKPDATKLIVPILIDLKLYQGSLERLITSSLPVGLDLQTFLDVFTVRIYLDSFNEVPRKFVESGECEVDLRKFIRTIGASAIVIGSRTLDGLDKLGFEAYELAAIDEASVVNKLDKLGISLKGRFEPEMTTLLRRPFFFRYILDREVALPAEPHPREFYRTLLSGVSQTLGARLHLPLDLETILRPVAYQALNSGEEAFPLATLLRAIEANLTAVAERTASAINIANGLVACSILVSYSGERIAFVHQSITEYLASLELAEHFAAAPELLREKLSLRRWDQALFLALSHLHPPLDHSFIRSVLGIDLSLAIASAKFVETERAKLAERLLDELIQRRNALDEHDFALNHAMREGFPVDASHLPKLHQLIQPTHPLRGAAAELVIRIRGEHAKADFLRLLVDFRSDYNFCANSIGPALACFASEDDLIILAQWARELETSVKGDFDRDNYHGFVSGVAEFAAQLPLAAARLHFMPSSPSDLHTSPIRTAVFREILQDRRTTESLQCACDLLLLGDAEAAVATHFILRFSKPEDNLDVQYVNVSHINALLSIDENKDAENIFWARDALYDICTHRIDLRRTVEALATRWAGLAQADLLMCSRQDQAPAFAALEALLQASDDELHNTNYSSIEHWDLNWHGRESLLLNLLERKIQPLASALLGAGVPSHLQGFGRIEITRATWWLEWINASVVAGNHWFAARLVSFLSEHATESLARRLLTEINDPKSNHRSLLLSHVLPYFSSVTTDDLSGEAAEYAINDLLERDSDGLAGCFLGGAATETFATERMLPLVTRVDKKEAERIRGALDQAGQRHGRRYF